MIKKQTTTLLLLIFSTLVHWNNLFAQPFKFTKTTEGISLTEGTHPVYFYQQQTKSLDGKYPRANYLHPLYGLNDEVLTEDFPADHLHQRGIFWAWHQLIVDGERIGDGWECKGIEWNVTSTNTNVDKKAARLEVAVEWNTIWRGDNITFVKETTVITTYKTTSDYREMDFDISLTAVGHDVWIGGSEDHKGYSGFSARTILPDDIKFRSEKGVLTPTDPAIQVGGWVDMIATFGETKSGFTMMADTTRMTSWHGWILRNKKSMQNAAFPGREPFKIAKGETLTMSYKLIIHKADWPLQEIESKFKTFIDKK
ncbi:MAG: DUF6807 family protein [Imperialibacter sp.]|uniref:DUF6807 family protein n=1 Tax=Imperialibacter sp. TaxID=2038411 RepID=UPI003A8415B7